MKKPWRLALCALCLIAAVWLTARYLLPIGLPFLLGWLVSRAAEPAVKRLTRRGCPRWLASFLCITGVLAALAGVLWLLGRSVCTGLTELAARLPGYLASLSAPLARLKRRLLLLAAHLPDGMAGAAEQWLEGFFAGSSGLADSVSGWLLRFVTGTLTSVPEIALFLLTALLSAYLISTELPRLCAGLVRLLPEARRDHISALWTRLKSALCGYIKAQVRLMGMTFLIVAAGLLILRQEHALLLAALIAAVDALPLTGDLVIERKVSLKGELLSLKVSMPYSDPEMGAVTLGYSLTTTEDSEPSSEITVESQERLVTLRYFTYSSMTDVSVTQGTLISQPTGEAAFTVADGEQEKPLAVAFLFRSQTTNGKEDDGRDSCRIQWELSLTPDQETPDAQEFDEYDLNLDMTFASHSPQKSATELNAVLTVGGGQRTGRTFTLNGTTRTPWVPDAVPSETVSLSDLPESDWNALWQTLWSDALLSNLKVGE